MSSASSEDNWVTTSADDDENDAVICAKPVNNAAPQVTRLAEQSATLAEVVTNGIRFHPPYNKRTQWVDIQLPFSVDNDKGWTMFKAKTTRANRLRVLPTFGILRAKPVTNAFDSPISTPIDSALSRPSNEHRPPIVRLKCRPFNTVTSRYTEAQSLSKGDRMTLLFATVPKSTEETSMSRVSASRMWRKHAEPYEQRRSTNETDFSDDSEEELWKEQSMIHDPTTLAWKRSPPIENNARIFRYEIDVTYAPLTTVNWIDCAYPTLATMTNGSSTDVTGMSVDSVMYDDNFYGVDGLSPEEFDGMQQQMEKGESVENGELEEKQPVESSSKSYCDFECV